MHFLGIQSTKTKKKKKKSLKKKKKEYIFRRLTAGDYLALRGHGNWAANLWIRGENCYKANQKRHGKEDNDREEKG